MTQGAEIPDRSEQSYLALMIDERGFRRRWEAIGSKLDERAARITGLARPTINRGEDDLDGEPLPEG